MCEEHFLPAREDKTVEEENAKVEDLSIKEESERNLPDQETVDSTAKILGESCQNETGGENCSRVVGGGGKKKGAKSRREREGDNDYDDEDDNEDEDEDEKDDDEFRCESRSKEGGKDFPPTGNTSQHV